MLIRRRWHLHRDSGTDFHSPFGVELIGMMSPELGDDLGFANIGITMQQHAWHALTAGKSE